MQDRVLLTVTEVTDDSTGIWEVGELEFGIMAACGKYLESHQENRKKLADWLLMLSNKCRASESPFHSNA